jgi:Tol biopolymer transport system component
VFAISTMAPYLQQQQQRQTYQYNRTVAVVLCLVFRMEKVTEGEFTMKARRTFVRMVLFAMVAGSFYLTLPHVTPHAFSQADSATPPAEPVKLIFVHHSCGENWLNDSNGGLGIALRDTNYFVSDTNYGWGPDGIGDLTDFGHWWLWFRGPDSETYLTALYNESSQHSTYARMASDPGGQNQVVMFKSCFPNSGLQGSPGDPPTTGDNPLRGQDAWSEEHTVANAKGIYNDLLAYFATRQDRLFIVVTQPPLIEADTSPAEAANARAFTAWLVNDWLDDYAYDNVAVFDFYNVLTGPNNHHRWNGTDVEHVTEPGSPNVAAYPTDDSHPSQQGNQKATSEFVSLLNVYYNRWQRNGETDPPTSTPTTDATEPTATSEPAAPTATTDAAEPTATSTLPDFETMPLYLPLVRSQRAASAASPTPTTAAATTPTAPTATPSSPAPGTSPEIAGCPILPANNIWNTPIDTLPVDGNSDAYIASIGADTALHPDFGSGLYEGSPIGIPYTIVPNGQQKVNVTFDYDNESDPGPYAIPTDAPIEGGPDSEGDRHVLVIEQQACQLYELFAAYPQADGSWQAGSGAIYDLASNALRPDGWTSADAAGLPILPGLVRYEEVVAGEIRHALRFTAAQTRRDYVWPARHFASSLTDPNIPPMGQRFRLKADFDLSGFSPDVQVILQAMKTYGIILADNGSDWYISGTPHNGWDNNVLRELRQVQGSDFEAVEVSSLQVDPDSGQAATSGTPTTPTPVPTQMTQPTQQGSIVYQLAGNGTLYRLTAEEGATPQNISDALDTLAPGSEDSAFNISPDGAWYVFSTDRFEQECSDWACVAVAAADMSQGEVLRSDGNLVHAEGYTAIASGGNLVVYVSNDGPHELDLFAMERTMDGSWGSRVPLTNESPYDWNDMPAISDDGSSVLFDCGNVPYGQEGTAICEVGIDGSGLRTVIAPEDGPGGSAQHALHHADYASDGSIVFEADWEGEQIWRLPAGASTPVKVTDEFGNDNSPCVLPDGRIVSLWLQRPGNDTGQHEIKVMNADGSSNFMAFTDADVSDTGIGCGQ